VDRDLVAVHDRLTGNFRDSYTSLTSDVVIRDAKQQQISAAATIPAAASVPATENHAAVLVFVSQITTVGNDPHKHRLERQDDPRRDAGRWLISDFTPV
jgi:Mce-associated membrane protein